MTDAKNEIIDGLKKAMEAELHGHHFYAMAAINTQDPKGKEIFDQLSKEEMDHFEFLKKNLTSYEQTGKLDPDAKLTRIAELDGTSPIFSEDIKKRIGKAHYEMTALSIGIQLEENAIKHYAEQAEKTEDADIKKFYEDLVEWEKGHYRALNDQHEMLKQDYWNEGGFAPF